MRRLVPGLEQTEVYGRELRSLIGQTNERLFRLVEESSIAFESGDRSLINPEETKAWVEEARTRLVSARNNFVAENIYRLIEPVAQDCASGPVMAPQVH
jgi:hypothetical protein